MLQDFYPLILQMVEAMLLAGTLLLAANFLGPKRPNIIKQRVYESGMDAVGNAHERHSVSFYLVAMIFIVFDVEVVFLYPWAVTFNEFLAAGVGLQVLAIVFLFIVILAIGLLYDIKKGGLVFDDTRRPTLMERSKPIEPNRHREEDVVGAAV
ncbi:MAG: NADH-quinone oxidoreductase subunit A [Rhodothermales bacterium]|nr:NADH-quinone oxidoreductase subunit A [Rhodothermales bacterium]